MATRADLRLKDLRGRERSPSKLMNVKVPVHVSDAIQQVAKQLGASKTEVVIALLNEGLDVTTQSLKGWKPPKETALPAERMCSVKGCTKAYVAKRLCANHYQASRRGKLPAKSRK